MNIHLLRSPELKEETYRNVLHLLQQFRGPMHFLECEEEVIQYNPNEESIIWETKKDFETSQKIQINYSLINEAKSSIVFPYKEKTKTWNQLFSECKEYRSKKNIAENDIVVLLTDIGNKPNWFGGVSPSMKNFFVQTSNWEHFFGTGIDCRFPIAYEVIIWVMRYYMFSTNEAIMKNIHKDPIGCIMDFCQDKSQIILKMRTADVCQTCMQKIIERDIPPLHTRQFFDILDGIRLSMTFRSRSVVLTQPSRMEIKGQTKKIFLTDLGGLELRLNPKEKALYLLFLKHPDGLYLTDLQDHKVTLIKLYGDFCSHTDPKILNRAIDVLISPLENDVNVVLSRINRKIKDTVGDSLLDFYSIKGDRGEKKSIKLNRELLTHHAL